MKKEKKKMQLKKGPRIFLSIIFILILSFSSYKIGAFLIDAYKSDQEVDDIKKKVIKKKSDDKTLEEEPLEEDSIDFNELLAMNSDIVGWIKYNKINYPVVQTTDNSYYLSHSFRKSKNELGSIFMDYRNTSYDDRNVVIYGHNAANGNMFGALAYLFRKGFASDENNQIIQIMNVNGAVMNYRIFSYYIIEKEDYYITTSFYSDQEFQTFIDTIKKRSNRNYNLNVSTNDRILTLSTCYGSGNTTKRIVVHAKLIQ